MAQIAQQEHLYIKVVEVDSGEITAEEKTLLRKAFIRGTIMEVELRSNTKNLLGTFIQNTRILGYFYKEDNVKSLKVYYYDFINEEVATLDCGTFDTSDYTDDTPSPDIQ